MDIKCFHENCFLCRNKMIVRYDEYGFEDYFCKNCHTIINIIATSSNGVFYSVDIKNATIVINENNFYNSDKILIDKRFSFVIKSVEYINLTLEESIQRLNKYINNIIFE